jgi:hypothetical protein
MIHSNRITNAYNCFNETTLRKNVYIPFTYENGVNTETYNAFINAGYDKNGTTNGVYLKDINNPIPKYSVDVSNYNYTLLEDGTLYLNKYTGTSPNVIGPSIGEE